MSAYGSYQNAYRRASVNTMDQGKLIVMLYDGAIRNINFALQHIKEDEVEKTHNCLTKAECNALVPKEYVYDNKK